MPVRLSLIDGNEEPRRLTATFKSKASFASLLVSYWSSRVKADIGFIEEFSPLIGLTQH